MPFCNVILLFSSSVCLTNLFGSVDRHLVRPRARRSRNERYFSKPNFIQNKKCIRILVYVALWFVCRANKSHPNRSILSFPMTGKKFISCSPFYSHLNLVALEKIFSQRHLIITHGHAAAITLLLFLLIFAFLALFLCLTKIPRAVPSVLCSNYVSSRCIQQ
jgi:hypothetical protein